MTLKNRLKSLDTRVLGDPAREEPFPFPLPKFLAVVAGVFVALVVLRELAGAGVAGAALAGLFVALNVVGERRRRSRYVRPHSDPNRSPDAKPR